MPVFKLLQFTTGDQLESHAGKIAENEDAGATKLLKPLPLGLLRRSI